jgi:hypothetical protein
VAKQEQSDRMQVFPFFLGAGRSGTTLLRAMFDSHPDMAIPNESGFIVRLARERRHYETSDGFDVDAFTRDFSTHVRFRPWDLTGDEVREALGNAVADFSDAIRRLYHFYARREGKGRYGDKTPSYVMHLPLLAQLFPEARFVHIIRDGRDVALSHLDIEGWGPQSLDEAALHWKRQVLRGSSDGPGLGADRYREIRYEQLVDDPETTLVNVCEFVHLPYDVAMLRYFERAEQVAGATPHFRNIYRPPTKGLRDWRQQMTDEDVMRFESVAGDLLARLGYETGGKESSRLQAWSWRLRVKRQRWRKRLDVAWRRARRRGEPLKSTRGSQ